MAGKCQQRACFVQMSFAVDRNTSRELASVVWLSLSDEVKRILLAISNSHNSRRAKPVCLL